MKKIFLKLSNGIRRNYIPALQLGLMTFSFYQLNSIKMENLDSKKYDDSLNDSFHRTLNSNDEFYKNTVILTGNANKVLSQEITEYLHTKLCDTFIGRFQDGECNIQILENVRGKDIYIIQPTCPPVNENLMELLLLVTSLRRASARKINVVIPYYGYCRQDRKNAPRASVAAADVAGILETAGVDRVITIDLHYGQLEGFFGPRVPVDNLEGNLVAINYFKLQNIFDFKELVVVSPDANGVGRAKKFREQLQSTRPDIQTEMAMIIKQRTLEGVTQMNLVGQVKNKDVIIIDDIIDSAETLCEATRILKQMGAKRVVAFVTHALFSGQAINKIKESEIDQIIITNTIPENTSEYELGIRVQRLSVAPLLAEAIYRIQTKASLSSMFSPEKDHNF